MTVEEFIYQSANTAGISNVSTRGQPITSTLCKKDIKGSIKSAISENPSFKQFLEENHAYGRIAYSNFSNREIINGTINWSSTSEGSDYWFGLYVNTKK